MATKKITFNASSLPSLSLAMIVKNESENLKRLLPIVEGVVDEIVIVDTGSTDDTKQVAESFGATVYDFPWCDDFSAARNESLRKCTKDYILWLDADDQIERQDISKLKWFIKDNLGKAIFLGLFDKRYDRDFQSIQLRAFPNNKELKFSGKVHEQISFSAEALGIKYATCEITVYHLGYLSYEAIAQKLERNLKILLNEVENNPNQFFDLVNIAKTLIGLKRGNEASPYVERALNLIRIDKTNVSRESEFLAILTKLTLLSSSIVKEELVGFMEEFKPRFEHLPMFRYTYGEVAFKFRDYATAYKYLLPIKNGKLNLSMMPVDANALLQNLTLLLLSSSLAIGDFKTAEVCISRMILDDEYKIKRR
jgi:glycosyltransferase involved in cell wall biosynthesis